MFSGFVLMFFSSFYGHPFWFINVCAFVLGILFIYSALIEFPIGKLITLDISKTR